VGRSNVCYLQIVFTLVPTTPIKRVSFSAAPKSGVARKETPSDNFTVSNALNVGVFEFIVLV
jgi:hypothetical protein